jgi:hypothetical protein
MVLATSLCAWYGESRGVSPLYLEEMRRKVGVIR